MKIYITFFFVIFLISIIGTAPVFGSAHYITCGPRPGEIYFTGFTSTVWGAPGLYYSANHGEDIELRDSVDVSSYNAIIADAADNTLYWQGDEQYTCLSVSIDGGFTWDVVNDTGAMWMSYASGIIPGEIYRDSYIDLDKLRRSENYGVDFLPCACTGIPDTLLYGSNALGVDSGEVYSLRSYGNLYYSTDYGENFIHLDNLYTSWGIPSDAYITNGAVPGEIFAVHHQWQRIWRISDYGQNVEDIVNFNLGVEWSMHATASLQPGELYFLAKNYDMVPGGTMRIYHTTDYFQNWSMYEHEVEWANVYKPVKKLLPSRINLTIYPNPTNAAFNITYVLNTTGEVELKLYNILGCNVWKYNVGTQIPGNYKLSFTNEMLSSGTYYLHLQTEKEKTSKILIITK